MLGASCSTSSSPKSTRTPGLSCVVRFRSTTRTAKPYGVRLTPQLISMKARMEGFIAFDYEKRYPEARAYLADLARKGQLKYSYYVVGGGLDGCAKALQDMFDGKNIGKTVVSFQDEGDRNPKL